MWEDYWDGFCIDPKDLDAVLSLKEQKPTTVGELHRLLGFISYYRTYIHASRIVKKTHWISNYSSNS